MERTIKVLLSVGQIDETRTKINPIWMRVARWIPILIDNDETNPLWYWSCIIEDDKIYGLIPITQEFYEQIFLDRENIFWKLHPTLWIAVIHHIHKPNGTHEIVDFDVIEVSFNTTEGPEDQVTSMRKQFDLRLATLIE